MPLVSPSRPPRAPVRLVIADHIVTVEQLEILLLLRRGRDCCWTVDQVDEQLQTGRLSIRHALEDLARRGLVLRTDAGFRYGPPLPVALALAELACLHSERQFAIFDVISHRRTAD